MLRVQKIVKEKGFTMLWLADKVGITRESLYSSLKTGKLNTLKTVSDILGCTIHELINAPKGYKHLYINGVWSGLTKIDP
jgi:DNA-binding phage protein